MQNCWVTRRQAKVVLDLPLLRVVTFSDMSTDKVYKSMSFETDNFLMNGGRFLNNVLLDVITQAPCVNVGSGLAKEAYQQQNDH